MANNPRFIGLGKRSAWLAIPALFVAYVPLWAGEPQATLSALPPDYAVYNDEAGMVCLQAARTGKLLDRNGDASSILQKAIDLLPASGGKVYVAGGNYRLSRTLVIRDRHGVHLEGVARGLHGPGRGGTVLWSDKPVTLLEIFGDDRLWGITVSNLLLTGSGKDNGKAGIWVHGTTDVMTFYNVSATECGIGFHIQGGRGKGDWGIIDAPQFYFCDPQNDGIGLWIERACYAKIVGGEFSDCTREGIRLSASSPDDISGIKIIGVTAIRCGGAGILIGKHCDDVTVTGGVDAGGTHHGSGIVVSAEGNKDAVPSNIILSEVHAYNNEADGITVDRARHVIIKGSICSVHRHIAVPEAAQKAGIRVRSGAEDVIVTGNITYGNREKGIVDETGRAQLVGNSDKGK